MSFSELANSNYNKKREEININAGGKNLVFHANEIGSFKKSDVLSSMQMGADWVSKLVVYSITDEDGVRMSQAQAEALGDEHANLFLDAAIRVNNLSGGKKKVSKKK